MQDFIYQLNTDIGSMAEEAYKVLRTNIQFYGVDSKIKTITVTSCMPGEGKTTTSVNLAASTAGAGLKVLVVDADLRKPLLIKNPGCGNLKGLSNLLSGHANTSEVILKTSVPGLSIITCGVKPPNPAELLGSGRFTDFIEEMKRDFDMIIIDTPPLGSVIDCALVAPHTDGTLIVVQSKATNTRDVLDIKQQLEKVNARILGIVLNKISRGNYSKNSSYYDFYGGKRSLGKGWFRMSLGHKRVDKHG